ncbi:MAG: AraC family transcriptional regulator, partial [Verrucomicrobiae bacterium]|nr:AraC family transcriptional regulator [Verrucomicrobiae bacterium]
AIDLVGFAPEAMREAIFGGNFEHFILGRPPFQYRWRQWTTGSFALNTGCYGSPTRVLGSFPSGRLCVGYHRNPTGAGWINGFEIGRGQLQVFAERTEANYRCSASSEWVAIGLERGILQAAAVEHFGREVWIPQAGSLNLNVPQRLLVGLDRLIQGSLREDSDPQESIVPITRLLAEILVIQNPDELRKSALRWRKRAAKMEVAEAYLRSRLALPFDGRSLADVMGLGERSLQAMFKHAYGIGPAKWARCLALHEVRKELSRLAAGDTIIRDVARAHGFEHMGRFSGYYKELFGESPSATLARL